VPPGIPIHLEFHKRRHAQVVLHHHPRYATLWASAGRVPPCHDQSSSLGGGEIVAVTEYEGGVGTSSIAAACVEAMGDAEIALLAHHGVLVTGDSVRAVHQRAVALEQRARHAFQIQQLGGAPELPQAIQQRQRATTGNEFHGFWEAMVRRRLRDCPEIVAERVG
jgi:ribulose-5-phosphate 4-epimerase/fuculose-1-phosphate aldolase